MCFPRRHGPAEDERELLARDTLFVAVFLLACEDRHPGPAARLVEENGTCVLRKVNNYRFGHAPRRVLVARVRAFGKHDLLHHSLRSVHETEFDGEVVDEDHAGALAQLHLRLKTIEALFVELHALVLIDTSMFGVDTNHG